jgi:segregation and condensation protein A
MSEAAEEEYKVKLDFFEGPLDLLLYLIKRDEIDIYSISIERIAKQYLSYIETFKLLNIDLASEFVVMAANLMYIKSRTLLPKPEQPPEEDAEEDDPRWDLIRQLVEYKKFKDAANYLGQREMEQGELFEHIAEAPKIPTGPPPPPNVNIFDLIRAFQNVLKRFQEELELGEIKDDPFTVSDQIDYLLKRFEPGRSLHFSSLFDKASSRTEVIVTFLALLELIRLKQFRFEQADPLGEIEVVRREVVG